MTLGVLVAAGGVGDPVQVAATRRDGDVRTDPQGRDRANRPRTRAPQTPGPPDRDGLVDRGRDDHDARVAARQRAPAGRADQWRSGWTVGVDVPQVDGLVVAEGHQPAAVVGDHARDVRGRRRAVIRQLDRADAVSHTCTPPSQDSSATKVLPSGQVAIFCAFDVAGGEPSTRTSPVAGDTTPDSRSITLGESFRLQMIATVRPPISAVTSCVPPTSRTVPTWSPDEASHTRTAVAAQLWCAARSRSPSHAPRSPTRRPAPHRPRRTRRRRPEYGGVCTAAADRRPARRPHRPHPHEGTARPKR